MNEKSVAISPETGDLHLSPSKCPIPGALDYMYEFAPEETPTRPWGMKKVFVGDLVNMTEMHGNTRVVMYMGVWDEKSQCGRWARFDGSVSNFTRYYNGRCDAIRFEMKSYIPTGNDGKGAIVWDWNVRSNMWAYVPDHIELPGETL